MDAEDLYRLPPEEFTAARDAEARRRKADGDKEAATQVKALRRPSVAAWLLNLLSADERDQLEGLLELGPGLAQAQATGDAAALRTLGAQRRRLVEAVTGSAVALGGRPVTSAVREEVAGSLEAALADPASAEAVRSGRLVRSLSYAGFGGADLSDAVAPASRSPAPGAPEDRAERAPSAQPRKGADRAAAAAARAQEAHAARLAEAQAGAHDAAGRLDDAVRACEAAERRRAQAQEEVETLAAEVERRAAALAEARQDAERAGHEATVTQRAADQARAKVERAQARAEAARSELDRLRRDGPARA